MLHSPAQIVAAFLIGEALCSAVVDGTAWPVFVGHMPDGEGGVDELATVYDTGGIHDGDNQETGEAYEHPGLQIKIRSKDYQAAYGKIVATVAALNAVHNKSITVDGTAYLIAAISQTSTIAGMGLEPGTRRFLFSGNFILAVTQV